MVQKPWGGWVGTRSGAGVAAGSEIGLAPSSGAQGPGPVVWC